MNKRLVFSFYITNNWEEIITNKLHFKCLDKYNEIFDEVYICFIVADDINRENITKAQSMFVDIFKKAKVLSFKEYHNTCFRESLVFKNEVVDKLNDNVLIFFCHNKGITNIEKYESEEILFWIYGMYHFSLCDMHDVENALLNRQCLSYGSYLCYQQNEGNVMCFEYHKDYAKDIKLTKYQWYYIGTFFWVNNQKLKNFIDTNNITMPRLYDRFYDEQFLGHIAPHDVLAATYKNQWLINAGDFYKHAHDYTKLLYENIYDDLMKNFKNILENL